ncbi:MAG: hypothetical protein HC912_09205 [Saprospiraceae bacterium]|nr:hypothetical protein [Saprospiraceae bacterium]
MLVNSFFIRFGALLFWSGSLLLACVEATAPTLYNQHLPQQTSINFANQLQENEAFNIIEYLYYYNGGGVAVGDINNDNLPDIYSLVINYL